jgi:hypothetical protein
MKSDKLKKLLKQIKKLRKLRKSRKLKTVKKSINKNLKLSAEVDILKDKVKNQELQLSQIRNPGQAPLSRVSYETARPGQQDALNQANLEKIEKDIEKKLRAETDELINFYESQPNFNRQPNIQQQENIDYDPFFNQEIQRKYKPMIENIEEGRMKIKETDRGFNIINQRVTGVRGRPLGSKNKIKKSLDDTGIKSGIFNLVNKTGTLQKQIYKPDDTLGGFPKTDFNVNPIIQTTPDDVKAGFVEEEPVIQETTPEPVIQETTPETVPVENLKDASLSIEPVQTVSIEDTSQFTNVAPKKGRKPKVVVDTQTPVQPVVVDTPPTPVQNTKTTNPKSKNK